MKVLLRHIFSFLLLLVYVAVSAQDQEDNKRSKSDTLKVNIDSLNIEADTLILKKDTLKVLNDTIRIPVDTVGISLDSLGVKEDTTFKIPPDAIQVDEPQESIKQPKDTIIGPSGFELFIDYGKLLTIPSDFETKAEAGVSYTYREKLMVLIEVGYGKISPQEAIKNGSYTSEGIYARGGLAYGGEILPKSYLYIGMMYGTSRFDDSGTIQIESQVSVDLNEPFSRTDLEASWIEFIIITETELRNNIFLGSKWRLRNLRNFDYDFDPIVYAIPGYGRSFDNSIPAVNLFLKYRF
jgi:hypothetical protein